MTPLRTISTLLLCLLVLASSTNFRVGIHFCGGQVDNIALFKKADPCPMERAMPPCHKATSCCDDTVIVHDAQEQKNDLTHFDFTALATPAIVQHAVLIADIIPAQAAGNTLITYDPPPRPGNTTVATLQVFRI